MSQEPFPIWPENAVPGARGTDEVDVPTLAPFLAEAATASRAAVLVCPGGGYGSLAPHEGSGYAKFLNSYGIHAFVLKYRLGSRGYRHPAMLLDAARALGLLRHRAREWGFDANRIGVMGSSAGGHLAASLLTLHDHELLAEAQTDLRCPVRPDFGILCYPVIALNRPCGHTASRKNLLGENPDPKLLDLLSPQDQVGKTTPPCFLWHTWEDSVVPVQNSLIFSQALADQGIPFDLHVYRNGRHGIGLAKGHPWTQDLVFWLRENFLLV